jgi:Mannosyltransferase (PIG-V)
MNHEAVEHLRSGAIAPPRPTRRPAARFGWQAARRLLAVEGRREAIADSAGALFGSRALVWLAGSGTLAVLGFGPLRKAFDPPGLTRGFGWLGDLLAGPAARWDSAWYLVIAQHGYRPDLGSYTAPRDAFFPLYPLALRAISWLGSPPVLAGVLVSTLALALALYGIHRLTTLELARHAHALEPASSAREAARLAVLLTAFAPMAFFLSAVYSESLFLALSVGVFWSARHGRWALAGALGAMGAATRSAGVVLLLPALILYLYGPREDRAPELRGRVVRAVLRMRSGGARGRLGAALVPRYRVRRDILWLAMAPAGLAAYMAYLGLAGGDALAPFHAQGLWGRHFASPYGGVWSGIKAGFEGARQLLSLQQRHNYFPLAAGSPSVAAGHNLLLLAFLAAAVPAAIGVLRVLPFAYGAYVVAALAMPLSYPVPAQPLMSLPRFLLVLFPLNMWLAARTAAHPRRRAALLVLSAVLLAFFTADFATWHWVS